MSNPLMEKMLDLPEFEVTDFKQNDNDMGFYVETKKRPTFCPVCGCYMPNLVIYKSRKQTVRDISVLEKRTALIINRHYYECRECGGRFAEPLESVGDNERITKRLRTTLALLAPYCPFTGTKYLANTLYHDRPGKIKSRALLCPKTGGKVQCQERKKNSQTVLTASTRSK